MLTKEREDRYSAADVLEHPWVSVSLINTRHVTYARIVSALLFSLVQLPSHVQALILITKLWLVVNIADSSIC